MEQVLDIAKYFKKSSAALRLYASKDLPRIVGIEALNHFKKSFDNGGFTDRSLKKWTPSKRTQSSSEWYGFEYRATTRIPNAHPRRVDAKKKYKARKENPITNYSKAAIKRKTMNGYTGDLKESLYYSIEPNKVVVRSDLAYATVHNEGGSAQVFGKKSFTMPKRQFAGESETLDSIIAKIVSEDIERILGIINY